MFCYICGETDPDTKDHVIPRAFLGNGNFNNQNRLTLPAHRSCNEEFSEFEEYTRDAIVPEAEFLGLPGSKDPVDRLNRSLSKGHARKRRLELLKGAKKAYVRTPAGIITGRAVLVKANGENIQKVGKKIGRGVFTHDTGFFISDSDFICARLKITDVDKERQRELKKGNPFWRYLSLDGAKHDNYSECIMVRRIYMLQGYSPYRVGCYMGVALLSEFFICYCEFIWNGEDLKFPVYGDPDIWTRSDDLSDNAC